MILTIPMDQIGLQKAHYNKTKLIYLKWKDERDHIFVKDFVAILDKIIEIKKSNI